jgi:hypothetical protein
VGSRNAFTKVERLVVVFGESETLTGIEGKYLKLGNKKAEAVSREQESVEETGKEEFVTITLLKGYIISQRGQPAHVGGGIGDTETRLTSAYGPPRPINLFKPLTNSPQPRSFPSSSIRLVQSLCPVQTTIC